MKKIIAIFFSLLLVASFCMSVSADTRLQPRLVDYADILSDSEEAEITEKIDEISERQQFDVVIVTVNDTDNKSITAFADDYFDYNGFGYGPSHDGCVLVIDMGGRDWWISTCGYGITAFTDAGIDYIGDQITEDLSDGFYYDAFMTYADLCDDFVSKSNSGSPYDTGNLPKEGYNWFMGIVVSVIIGFVIALIITLIMKGKLKSVRFQPGAKEYVVPGSMNVTASRDIFLYRNVSRRAKPKESSGSSTHTSSSGRSHGGGGGRF